MIMKRRGFTLIELLVVISIIGILVAVGVVSYTRAIQISRDAKRKTDLEQIRQALETYRSEIGAYPATSGWQTALSPTYITTMPTDPKGGSYDYKTTSTPATTYIVCASLELGGTTTLPACSGLSCGGVCNYDVTNP